MTYRLKAARLRPSDGPLAAIVEEHNHFRREGWTYVGDGRWTTVPRIEKKEPEDE